MTTLENLEKYYYAEHKDKIFCTKSVSYTHL